MEYQYRFISEKLLRYIDHFPVLVLTGARQVGKSTLLKKLLGDRYEIVVFDPVTDVENAGTEPELFFKNHPGPLILDEIQYAPELVPVIKRLVDENHLPGKYILTGSQQWGMMKNISESLAGRAVLLTLMGFHLPECAGELHKKRWPEKIMENGMNELLQPDFLHLPFSLSEHIYRGQMPAIQRLPLEVIPGYLNSYLATYIERDVRLMAEISDLQQFGRFFRLCGALSGQEINYSQLGRDIGITPQTSRRWLDILRATFQWIEIPAYSGNTLKRVSGKPKGYMADTGMLTQSLYISTPQALASHPSWGNIVESLVATDILKTFSTITSPPAVYHWRSHSGAEVDLILEQNGKYFPIEIKSTTRPSKKDTRGIKAFRETYPNLNIQPGVVIHLGDKNLWLSEDAAGVSYFTL